MRLLLARHAPVATKGICYGQSDVPTSLDDDAACEALAAQLETHATRIAQVWCSPWRRARGPAERLAARLGLPLAVDDRLSELSFGAWEGRPYPELEKEPAFAAWMADWQSSAPPGGERLEQLVARVRQWRADVVAARQDVLAVTHAGVVRALRAEGRGIPYASVIGEPVEPLLVEVAPATAPAGDQT